MEDLHPPGLTIQMPAGQIPVGETTHFWTRTLDSFTRAGLPESVVSTMSGPSPEGRTQNTDKGTPTQSQDGNYNF